MYSHRQMDPYTLITITNDHHMYLDAYSRQKNYLLDVLIELATDI
jgi:hypothetical protein